MKTMEVGNFYKVLVSSFVYSQLKHNHNSEIKLILYSCLGFVSTTLSNAAVVVQKRVMHLSMFSPQRGWGWPDSHGELDSYVKGGSNSTPMDKCNSLGWAINICKKKVSNFRLLISHPCV